MPSMGLHGMIFVAAPTPFGADESVDFKALQRNIQRWIEAGVDGVLVLGTTGEAAHLDDGEAEEIVAAARDVVPRDKVLVAGTGRPTTVGTIRWTARIAQRKADFALVLTPHAFRNDMSRDALKRHYQAVADESDIPILLYSMPANTGVTISSGLAAEFSRHPRVFGIKDSSGDVAAIFQTISLSAPDFRVFNGSARAVFPSLASGAAGSILAIASVAPEMAVAAHRAFGTGDLTTARRAAVPLARLSARLAPYGIAGLKAAMTLRGMQGGSCRRPLGIDRSAMPVIESALAESGVTDRALKS